MKTIFLITFYFLFVISLHAQNQQKCDCKIPIKPQSCVKPCWAKILAGLNKTQLESIFGKSEITNKIALVNDSLKSKNNDSLTLAVDWEVYGNKFTTKEIVTFFKKVDSYEKVIVKETLEPKTKME
jgi:hypothetical protein